MRFIPARKLVPQPAKIKGTVTAIQRISPPVKGLTLLGKASEGDPQTATILTNWIIKEDRVCVRPGRKLVLDAYPGGSPHPIVKLPTYMSNPVHVLASTNHTLIKAADGTLIASGFGSDDWDWTAFANLAQTKYTVMVNGTDGVWSYDGLGTAAPTASSVTAISATNPAQLTVGGTEIAKYANGRTVMISGATGAYAVCNGLHTIAAVGVPAGTFSLVGVDTTGATGSIGTVTAKGYGSMMKEDVRAPANAPFCNPNNFDKVLAHINRLYFADSSTLAVYYLPLQSKGGPVNTVPTDDMGLLTALPLNAYFKAGGYIKAIASWTVDGGNGMDDKLAVFTSNGECAIFTGIDPADDGFGLVGVFQHDHPMSKHSVIKYGGDLWVLTSTGLAPMTTLMRAETEKLDKAEKGVVSFFREISAGFSQTAGWSLTLDKSTGRMICNMPLGSAGSYQQMVRFMPDPVWAKWRDMPARCWSWVDDGLFVGTDEGKIYQVDDSFLSDDGLAITAEVRGAWSNYKTPGVKHFKLVRVYAQSTGLPVRPFIDMAVSFIDRRPFNQPDTILPAPATPWGSPWGSPWGRAKQSIMSWNGVGRIGNVGAPHILIAVNGATYELSGFDVVYEQGIVTG